MKLEPKNKFFLVLAVFIILPFIVPFIINDPVIITIVNIGTILGFLFYVRTRVKNLASGLISSGFKWQCLVCGKENKESSCPRCGSRQSKMI